MPRSITVFLICLLLAGGLAAQPGDSADKHPPGAFDHYKKGRALVDQGNYQAALAEYEAAIRLDPRYDFAYGSMGYAHF